MPGVDVFTITRSAAGTTLILLVLVLFKRFGSEVLSVAVTMLEIEPTAVGVTTKV